MVMNNRDPFDNQDIKRLQLFLYLMPVVGFFPALWTLYRRQGNREQKAVSRLAVRLALGWLVGYILLATGSNSAEFLSLPLLLISSLLTSGYFLVNIWLMVRVWQRLPIELPWIGSGSDRPPLTDTNIYTKTKRRLRR